MAVMCSVCAHAARGRIDAALVAGESARKIAAWSGVPHATIGRHRKHVGTALLVAKEKRELARAQVGPAELERLWTEAQRLGEAAEVKGDLRTALQAVREMTRLYELQARLIMQARSDARDVAKHPVYLELQADLLAVTRSCVACSSGIARKMRQRLGIDVDCTQ